MHPQLTKLQKTLSEAISGILPEALARHPCEGKWSVAEILEHLNLTYVGSIKNLERCLAGGVPRASADRKKSRWARIVVTRLGYFPPGRKSPERVLPRGIPAEQVTQEIMQNILRLDAVIGQCEARFEARSPIADHPLLGPLTATEWRGFHLTHGRHHAKQIRALKKNFLLRD